MSLTDVRIRNTKSSSKPVRLFDGGGLYLEIMPSGSKLWRYKYRFGGKEKRIALGTEVAPFVWTVFLFFKWSLCFFQAACSTVGSITA